MQRVGAVFVFGLLAVLMSSCGGLPPEAESMAASVATSLGGKDHKAFTQLVLPAQREGSLSLPAQYPIEIDKKPNEATLADVLEIDFFQLVSSASVAEDGASLADENSGSVIIMLNYGDGEFTAKTFELKKHDGKWYVDFKATLEGWHRRDGAAALSVIKLQ